MYKGNANIFRQWELLLFLSTKRSVKLARNILQREVYMKINQQKVIDDKIMVMVHGASTGKVAVLPWREPVKG